ncbi:MULTISPECIES: excinuclease ABC subunit UvrA [unclassified Lentimicrobium]|uniref:excinuclease ABC subunit UvrA n=1 Tax=unclassified Lentimicrobium TaxID=2677434 RepID=UPI001551EE1A|nr:MULTISPECIES: excinuclease ABC subunit UvrA [unclassified Lentimicrobium]NPD45168.1 excinuclease ABC subunit UvrA [Lentimicrobium sp. S6]NPD84498.1 excinuclease ABC subunit UvrA [Lentimicrobium sp. L6]
MNSKNNKLIIKNAEEHNLKNIDVQIPHNSLTVITGVSGSGKSSLAYQVIFNESQRRFLESFSSYSRSYIGKMEKPKVEEIKGLHAALAIHQKTAVSNPRSTVGTLSGIYDYLRLLFARLGEVKCLNCGAEMKSKAENICSNCGYSNIKIRAKLFSFNSSAGACPTCKGLGLTEQIDPKKLIADETKSLTEGALVPTTPTGYIVYSQVRVDELDKVCRAHDFSVDIPWKQLTLEQQNIIWYGSDRVKILFGKHSLESRLKWKGITAKPREEAFYKGMLPIMEEILKRDRNDNILRFASSFTCTDCEGTRLRKEARNVHLLGKNISDLSAMTVADLKSFLDNLKHEDIQQDVLEHILKPIFKRLYHLELLGLNYLTLERESASLSGGEAQRIRLASQLGTGLQGILYILDEPSIGLHARDNQKLIQVLRDLRDNGNTVVVVEHDEETIKAADYLIDIGPKAGVHGGEILFQGETQELLQNPEKYPKSITAQSLSTTHSTFITSKNRKSIGEIKLTGLLKNNLKNIDVDFQLGLLNVVTGVSGAGKSTLVNQILAHMLRNKQTESEIGKLESSEEIKKVIEIDQSPIGRTPRSNPATYTDLFDHIRDLFSKQEESKNRAYKKGQFSFNNKGGRCEHCQGAGRIQLGMHFLGNVEIECEHCHGKRFSEETLEVTYQGKNIYEVLEISIEEAFEFFQGHSKITRILDQLIQLDVGYLKLGQASTTLSGGEAQRIKLASELYKSSKGHVLYILDEPSVGLHKKDISYLIQALQKIVNQGNTVIVIEHDLDIIEQADRVIDLGPEGGENGGRLLFQGSPKGLIKCSESITGQELKKKYEPKEWGTPTSRPAIEQQNIHFYGVNTHNLKNIDVEIPLNQTTVITGVSGSGKSSLAFDTIYSESRNRFTENLSSYARRMMNKVKKPDLEQCSGLTPAIAFRQNRFQKNPRSTVGTATKIYDLYRLLFSRFGENEKGEKGNLTMSDFSFNRAESSCPHCNGMGIMITADPQKFISFPDKSLLNGAMDGNKPGKFFGDIHGQFVPTLVQVGKELAIDFSLPYQELSEEAKEIAFYGCGERIFYVEWQFKRGNRSGTHQLQIPWHGFINELNEDYQIKKDGKRGEIYEFIMSEIKCPKCHGKRLKEKALSIKFKGFNISDISSWNIQKAQDYFKEQAKSSDIAAAQIFTQLNEKFNIFQQLGLGYLNIDRPIQSLSGGEAQRLRIASQLVSDLCGLTYVLDEPTVGLHSRDTEKLLKTISQLKENGNTIIMVEHDMEVIKNADHIIDLGPKAGNNGGEIITQGNIEKIKNSEDSITGKYLHQEINIPVSKAQLQTGIQIKAAHAHNLKNIDLKIPSGGMVAVTGVSGSGKSSLVFTVIAKSYKSGKAENCESISFDNINSISIMDQQSIGTSSLSNCATYTGIFEDIRDIFAKESEAKAKGFKKSHFSFNSKDGSCPACKGMGQNKVPMDFLSDVWVTCEICDGKRYKEEVLEVKHQEKSIDEVLKMSISEAKEFFSHAKKTAPALNILEEVGLGYIQLGQATSTLSGGETQRLKLAHELNKQSSSKTLFIFDEPSTGLHIQDVELLLKVFRKLVDEGHSLIIVEHNIDIIKAADWIIDLGPEGGDAGGELIFSGKLEELKTCDGSFTSMALC